MLENLFKKRVLIYRKRDRATWEQIRLTLKEAGLAGVKAGHYLQESVIGGSLGGAGLDPRDFGRKKMVDRDIYWVRVLQEDEEKAKDVLRRNGLVPVVEENVQLDASLHRKPEDQNHF